MSPSPKGSWLAILACVAASGCAVGPDFNRPTVPDGGSYAATSPPPTTATPELAGGEAQAFNPTTEIRGDWWTLFHSPALNALIDQSFKANPDLKAAQAALKVARENTRAQRSAFLPSVSASYTATRARTSDPAPASADSAASSNLFTPQVSVG